MEVDYQKYRITTVALLVVLGINVVMPATVLAAGFYCNTDSDPFANTVAVDCCNKNGLNGKSVLFDDQNNIDYCAFLQDCNQSISDPFTELDSLLPIEKKFKILVAVFPLFNTFQYPDNGWNTASPISLDASFPYPTPPIFLLTSTFLN